MSGQPDSPTAFSYVRFSSKKQEEGDSIRRQTELTAAWAKRNKIHLDTSLQPDRGISAFRGKNRDLGALGAFLRLVENGRVLPGAYLVVESLDRLTREEIQPALLLILSLLQKGIRVVQLKPVETVYDSKSDTTPIILMLVELSRGHSESKVKSDRVGEAWGQRRKAARSGTGILTRKLPLWVEARDGRLVEIPERAAVVRRIFNLSITGVGLFSIMNTLTRDGVPAFGPSGRWSIAYLDLILKDRRAVGEFQPKLRGGAPDGPPIANYFPAVVTEAQWERARMGSRQRHRPHKKGEEKEPGRRTAGRIGERVNVFQGLLKSARDGFAYVVGSISKKNPHPTIRAAGHRLGTGRTDSFPLASFEGAVLSCLREIDPHEILNGETRDESLALVGELTRVEASIAAILADMDANGESPALFARLRVKEAQQRDVAAKLATARQKAAHPLSESWGEAQTLLEALESAPDRREARLRLREALRRIVEEVRVLVVPRGRQRVAVVQVMFAGGKARVYLIHHRPVQRTIGRRVLKEARTSVASFNDAAVRTIDLAKPKDAKRLAQALERTTGAPAADGPQLRIGGAPDALACPAVALLAELFQSTDRDVQIWAAGVLSGSVWEGFGAAGSGGS